MPGRGSGRRFRSRVLRGFVCPKRRPCTVSSSGCSTRPAPEPASAKISLGSSITDQRSVCDRPSKIKDQFVIVHQRSKNKDQKSKITHGIQFLGGDVWAELLGESTERTLDLLRRLDVFRLLRDHECHILLKGHVTVPAILR